jgi:hypothetical protein
MFTLDGEGDDVVMVERGRGRLPGARAGLQHDEAARLVRDPELGLRAEHAVALDPAHRAPLEPHPAGQRRPRRRERDLLPDRDVRRATHDGPLALASVTLQNSRGSGAEAASPPSPSPPGHSVMGSPVAMVD